MTRAAMLRAGYATLGLAFAGLAAMLAAPGLILVGLALGFVAGILLAFSDEDLPKWAGLAVIVYFVLTTLAFLATTPITISRGGENYYFAPPNLTSVVLYWIGLVSPLMLAGAGVVATWERERSPRILLAGAVGGFLLVAGLSVALTPDLDPACATDPNAPGCAGAAQRAAAEAQQQGNMLGILAALSALTAAVGAFWAAARPDPA